MSEPGFDLSDWQTRWEELQEPIADDPAQALPEVVRFVEQMLSDADFNLDEPVTAEGDDFDIVRSVTAAREVAQAAEQEAVDPEDIQVALDTKAQEISELLDTRSTAIATSITLIPASVPGIGCSWRLFAQSTS